MYLEHTPCYLLSEKCSRFPLSPLLPDEKVWTDLVIDPRSKALVLNGKPGHLQFYSLQQDKQLYNVSFRSEEHTSELQSR